MKIGVVICLLIEAYFFVMLYRQQPEASSRPRWILIAVESLGLVLILLVTGGVYSSFLWYAINPVLLSATLSPMYVSWLLMATFVTVASVSDQFALFRPEGVFTWPDRSSFFAIFALFTALAQIYNYLLGEISQRAAVMQRQMDHIKALYGATEAFSHRHEPEDVANLFASYSKTLTGATKIIVVLKRSPEDSHEDDTDFLAIRGPRAVLPDRVWEPHVRRLVEEKPPRSETVIRRRFHIDPDGETGILLAVRVRSSTRLFGVLSAFYAERSPGTVDEDEETLLFLAYLCAMALEK